MILSRHTPPETVFVEGIRPVEPEIVELDNGIPVYLIHSPAQDLVKIELLFKAGKWYEEKPLVANFTNKLIREGTPGMTSSDIAKRIDFYGAHLETSSDKDMAYVSLFTMNKHLEKTLPVLADVIMNPLFPGGELETLRQNKRQRFIVNNKKVRFVAKHSFNKLIFGAEHPYGKSSDLDDFATIHRDDLIRFHRNHYTADRCKIIAAGKIRPDFVQMLNHQFAGFIARSEGINNNYPASAPLPGTDKTKIHKSDAVQSAIRIGRILFNKTHPDHVRMKVLNTVLGGYFGSRLMTNIREDKGYTYGIGSALVSMQHSGFFFISSEVGTGIAGEAIKEVYQEIDRLHQDLIPDAELALVKNYMRGSFLRNLDGAFALSENYRGLLEYGLDYSYLHTFADVIRTVTAVELRELAQKYLDKNSLSELTVGK